MQKIFIWGTGNVSNQVLRQCNIYEDYQILGFIDNDLNKQNTIFWDRMVYSPNVLKSVQCDKIVILSNFYDEIEKQIMKMLSNINFSLENKNFFYKESLYKRYEKSKDKEIIDVLNYIKNNDLEIFNYEFVKKYRDLSLEIFYDNYCKMYFVYHHNKKLYFARYLNSELKVKEYYISLLVEQDLHSPHRYLLPNFNIREGDIVVDVGVAEGNFSLEVIDKASKIYMIESDIDWVEALKETFKNYKNKIKIIPNFVTSTNEGKYATLDQIVKEPINFLKMDIEGYEWDALLGSEELIKKSDDLKCAICSYHSDFDEILVKDILEKYGFKCTTSYGYMWYPYMCRKSYIPIKLSRGIVRGIKSKSEE